MNSYSYYDGFLVMSGPVESIKNIAKELEESIGKNKVKVETTEGGKYARLDLSEDLWDVSLEFYMDKYPEVEGYLSHGEDSRGRCDTLYSASGKKTVETDMLYIHSNGQIEKDMISDWELAMYFEGSTEQSLLVITKDGEKHKYNPRSNANLEKTLDSLKKEGLTIGFLAEVCCPYVVKNKKKEFIDSFVKEIPSAKDVAQIVLTKSVLSRDKLQSIVDKIEDKSKIYLIKAYVITDTERIYDVNSNTVTETVKIYANLYEENKGYDITEISEGKPVSEAIAGVDSSTGVEFAFGKKDKKASCNVCLTDDEEIEIPELEPTTGAKVVEIGSGCFKNCPSVKKIIIPSSITIFDEGCFAGPKKLSSLVFLANKDGSEDYINVNGNKITTLVTLKADYSVPKEIKTVKNNAFSACPKLKSVTLHSGVSLLNDALCSCKSLKTVVLDEGVTSINVTSLEKAGIKELVLVDGTVIKFADKYMYGCIEQGDSVSFSYAKAAKLIKKASTEANKYKIALELLQNHVEEVKEDVSVLMDIAIRYCIGKGDSETLTQLFDMKLDCNLDFVTLSELANRSGAAEVAALILSQSGSSPKKNVIRKETPAEAGPELYIKVCFEDNKSYSYFCSFKVKPGDKVFVGGKKAGEPGEVLEILSGSPVGRAAMYTLAVEKAFNIETVEVGDLGDLDDLPDLP